jgi:uncharacterized protein YegL
MEKREMKTYVGLVLDHSGSMGGLTTAARNDFNQTITGIKESAVGEQSAFATITRFGSSVNVETKNVPINNIPMAKTYSASMGMTALWDAVGMTVDAILASTPKEDLEDTTVAFLVLVTTDGGENSSRKYTAKSLTDKMNALQITDRWTFVFRVPKGSAKILTRMGIPAGNVVEWEQTEQDLTRSTIETVTATKSYFSARSTGKTSTKTFFADLSHLNSAEVSVNMSEATGVKVAPVDGNTAGMMIRPFCQTVFGEYVKGKALYQLTKTETVQEYKEIAIRDKTSGKIYTGAAARFMLNIPTTGSIRLSPKNSGNYELYVQSTSVNRKLVSGTSVLYK